MKATEKTNAPAPMDEYETAAIDASRNRLRRFVEDTSEKDLARPIQGDWTAASLLAQVLRNENGGAH